MRARALMALLLASSCGVQFTPETLVDSLRILSIVSDPPEVAPGQPSNVSVLFGDPTRVGQPSTIIWVGCEPDPQDQNRSACNDASILVKPTLITEYPPGLKLLGFGSKNNATYSASADVFNVLAPEDGIRQNGSVGQVMAIVIAEEVNLSAMGDELTAVFKRIENKETPAAIGLTRIVVSEKAQKNQNPTITNLTFDGAPLPLGARLQVRPGQEVALGVEVPESARENYSELQPSGPVEKQEVVVGAWYSSNGRFSRERFDVTATDATTFFAPGSTKFPEDPVPERRSGQLWLVVRDNRGAQAFEQFRFYVCDETLPTPKVTSITAPSVAGDPVLVMGEDMPRVLDILIGGVALSTSTYSGARGAFVGFPPELPPGTYPVTMRGQNCSSVETGLTYTVP
jgi:hypothetical protein